MLSDSLSAPTHLARFTREEGANWHCEPLARALYDQRVFDWLDALFVERPEAAYVPRPAIEILGFPS